MSAAVPLTEPVMAALAEAKARGLPEGWSVKFDVSWIDSCVLRSSVGPAIAHVKLTA
jgi:hypothetical protein